MGCAARCCAPEEYCAMFCMIARDGKARQEDESSTSLYRRRGERILVSRFLGWNSGYGCRAGKCKRLGWTARDSELVFCLLERSSWERIQRRMWQKQDSGLFCFSAAPCSQRDWSQTCDRRWNVVWWRKGSSRWRWKEFLEQRVKTSSNVGKVCKS